jgi:hypothetical protein
VKVVLPLDAAVVTLIGLDVTTDVTTDGMTDGMTDATTGVVAGGEAVHPRAVAGVGDRLRCAVIAAHRVAGGVAAAPLAHGAIAGESRLAGAAAAAAAAAASIGVGAAAAAAAATGAAAAAAAGAAAEIPSAGNGRHLSLPLEPTNVGARMMKNKIGQRQQRKRSPPRRKNATRSAQSVSPPKILQASEPRRVMEKARESDLAAAVAALAVAARARARVRSRGLARARARARAQARADHVPE